ncbi:hypothetical protein EGI31_16240 [Lacihabitans soyangensis]|uniref:Uncharacterized protein n=1 Tax=Lacihabitans soyangensis TaxID=869394 RepID=A0AAE3H5Q5_9BACT|nr:hypothetical protein [Lacihabitans soyangensis]
MYKGVFSEKENRARYRLHYVIRKEGFRLVTKNRTVYLKHSLAAKDSKSLSRLRREFGYAVQWEM